MVLRREMTVIRATSTPIGFIAFALGLSMPNWQKDAIKAEGQQFLGGKPDDRKPWFTVRRKIKNDF